MGKSSFKKTLLGLAALVVVVAAVTSGAIADRLFGFKPLDVLFPRNPNSSLQKTIVNENSDVISVVKDVGPSVVTVSAVAPKRQVIQFSPLLLQTIFSPVFRILTKDC